MGLILAMLIVFAAVEPRLLPPSRLSAREIDGDRPRAAATPFVLPDSDYGGSDGAAPTPTPSSPFQSESLLRCPDPIEPVAPASAREIATPIPLYQPVPYSTGEFVVVSNTNDHGANLRVAPRALARVLRVVPEGEVLEAVGGDLKVDRVPWAYVRDQGGTVGWIVSHMLTGAARVPGRAPLPFQSQGAVACATFTPTPTPNIIRLDVPGGDQATPGSQEPGAPGAPGGGGAPGRPRLT